MSQMIFASDNWYSFDEGMVDIIKQYSNTALPPYGNDELTKAMQRHICDLFETDVYSLLLPTGTATNALALSLFAMPYNRIIAHNLCHLSEAECGAVENYTNGASITHVDGELAKIALSSVQEQFKNQVMGFHQQKISAISIAQTTELGTIYSSDEISAIANLAHDNDAYLYVDGARFANSYQEHKTLAEQTWKLGVDAMSIGFTKNGAIGVELLLVFDKAKAQYLLYRAKRAGLIASKMYVMSAQVMAMLNDDKWIKYGKKANEKTEKLATVLSKYLPNSILIPQQSNQVFAKLDDKTYNYLKVNNVYVQPWQQLGGDAYRFICSHLTEDSTIDKFEQILQASLT